MKSRWKPVFVLIGLLLLVAPTHALAISNSECLDCHGDPDFTKELPNGKTVSLYVDEKRFNASVHGINEISCTDCHSDITKLNYDQEVPHPTPLKPVDCSQCHEDEEDAFKSSVHADLGEDGPSCKTCHNPHYTKYLSASTGRQRNEKSCLKCHNPKESHDFLPAKGLHFEAMGCSVCHSKGEKAVRLNFYSAVKDRVVPGEKIAKALGVDIESIAKKYDKNGDGKLETSEVLSLLKDVKVHGIRAGLKGEIVSQMVPEVHKITSEGISDCYQCHSEKAPVMQKVVLVLSKNTGETVEIPVDKAFLKSIYPVRFYTLDSSRVPLLDIIGALIVLGGIGFAGGHCTIRILTIPLRKRRKEGQR